MAQLYLVSWARNWPLSIRAGRTVTRATTLPDTVHVHAIVFPVNTQVMTPPCPQNDLTLVVNSIRRVLKCLFHTTNNTITIEIAQRNF